MRLARSWAASGAAEAVGVRGLNSSTASQKGFLGVSPAPRRRQVWPAVASEPWSCGRRCWAGILRRFRSLFVPSLPTTTDVTREGQVGLRSPNCAHLGVRYAQSFVQDRMFWAYFKTRPCLFPVMAAGGDFSENPGRLQEGKFTNVWGPLGITGRPGPGEAARPPLRGNSPRQGPASCWLRSLWSP